MTSIPPRSPRGDDDPIEHSLPAGWPAWPLPLLAGLLPLVATVVAYALSVRLGIVEPCNPFLDGCTSISRAARHDLPNHLFRALLLPAAALQAICWLLCGVWLRTLGARPTRQLRALPLLGIVAAVFLVLYGTFLGTEGQTYRWMRRYGVVVYFGGTCVSMLFVSNAVQRLAVAAKRVVRGLVGLSVALPLLGLANAFAPLFDVSETEKAALQNSTEWWGGLMFTVFFFSLAWLWRISRFRIGFSTRPPRWPASDAARRA